MSKQSMLHELQRVTRQSLDLLFPPQCANCKRSGHVLCPACSASIRPLLPPLCPRCGTPQPIAGMCKQCYYRPIRLTGLRSVGVYEGVLRACIHALKYEGNTRLAEPLGDLLTWAYKQHALQVDALVAVPLHSERQQQRGYNHAHLLAEICAAQLHIPLHEHMLERFRATPAQVGLSSNERQQNVAGAFRCSSSYTSGALYGRSILLIDDVYTTGATLEACAVPLFAAGARAIWGLVLARPL